MLADEILAAANSPADRMLVGAISALGIAIRQAKRFDLAPGIVVTANTISTSSFAAQLRALPLCRVPFEFTWMEWPGADPIYDANRVGNATAAAPAPNRMGVLIHADESRQKGSMTFAWSHRQEGVNACPLACFFDWRADAPEVDDLSRSFFRQSGHSEDELRQQIVAQSQGMPQVKGSSEADLVDDRSRFGFNISPAFKFWAEALLRRHGTLPGPGTQEWHLWTSDIRGEPGIARSILLLLNSKNLTHSEESPAPERLNRQRVKVGKLPLLGHTKIRIKLSRALQQRAGEGTQREASRFHAVRGHFKIRASGVYWWSDFMRGDPTRGSVHGTYKVDD
ncbi:hypothetical protein [Acidisphaera sp. S103]|uniref:hypothetical protein n=1 Tax=Acidisphaera sp. S103 TaxID=1747223 RepID=UPI00131BB8C0|nr:hypothetical protein [Acidisphaera sp. S103]